MTKRAAVGQPKRRRVARRGRRNLASARKRRRPAPLPGRQTAALRSEQTRRPTPLHRQQQRIHHRHRGPAGAALRSSRSLRCGRAPLGAAKKVSSGECGGRSRRRHMPRLRGCKLGCAPRALAPRPLSPQASHPGRRHQHAQEGSTDCCPWNPQAALRGGPSRGRLGTEAPLAASAPRHSSPGGLAACMPKPRRGCYRYALYTSGSKPQACLCPRARAPRSPHGSTREAGERGCQRGKQARRLSRPRSPP